MLVPTAQPSLLVLTDCVDTAVVVSVDEPLNEIAGRIATFRWIIPGYDQAAIYVGLAMFALPAGAILVAVLSAMLALDMRQALGDPVEIGFAADQSDVGMLLGLPHQMLAGTESHFQPHAHDRQPTAEELG